MKLNRKQLKTIISSELKKLNEEAGVLDITLAAEQKYIDRLETAYNTEGIAGLLGELYKQQKVTLKAFADIVTSSQSRDELAKLFEEEGFDAALASYLNRAG